MMASLQRRLGATWRRGLLGFTLSIMVPLVLWLPGISPESDELTFFDKLSFDSFSALRPETTRPEIRIIDMDQRSSQDLSQDPATLWSRSRHAELIRKLTADGAQLIVLDVFLGSASTLTEDTELARAMEANGRVVIAADTVSLTHAGIVGVEPVWPVEPFRSAAAGVGFVNPQKDTDGTVRRQFLETDLQASLPWVAARLANPAALNGLDRLTPRWLNFYGPSRTVLPRIRYADALQQGPGYFRDANVFVGGAPRTKRAGEESNVFRTPHSRWDGHDSSGVDLVALNFLNLYRGDSLTRLSAPVELLLIVATGLFAGFGLLLWRPRISAGLVLCGAAAVSVLAWNLYAVHHLWFSWLLIVAVQLPVAWLWATSMALVTLVHQASELRREPALGTRRHREQAARLLGPSRELDPSKVSIPDHELLRCVGKGAYGEVWLARNVVGILHAVKIIYRRAFESPEPYDREFRGITKFMPISRSHSGFVHILHVGRDDAAGYFYYVMEAADDERRRREFDVAAYKPKTLLNELRRRRRLAPEECLQLGLDLSRALSHLHQAQLIHRDIKPSNIIFVQGTPKLADIGLVTQIAGNPKEISFLGTRGYIAPEGPGTPLADIYSLGKVLYEAVTGLDREQFPSLPTTLLEQPEELFTQLNQIVLKACEPQPTQRFQSAAELAKQLVFLRDQAPEVGTRSNERLKTPSDFQPGELADGTGGAIKGG